MVVQPPAEGISLQKEFPDAKFYRVNCSCWNPDDDIDFSVESSDSGEITITTYTKQKTSWWDDPFRRNSVFAYKSHWLSTLEYHTRSFLNSLAHRLKVTWSVWTKGYVEYSQSTIMSRQQALNYAATLNQAVKDLEDYQKEQEQNNVKN